MTDPFNLNENKYVPTQADWELFNSLEYCTVKIDDNTALGKTDFVPTAENTYRVMFKLEKHPTYTILAPNMPDVWFTEAYIPVAQVSVGCINA